jgi:DUF1365 family protein
MTTIDRTEGTDQPFFDATLSLERRDWSAAAIRRQLILHPWMTAKVIGAIHWQAFRLWSKGLPYHPHPNPAAGRRREREVS